MSSRPVLAAMLVLGCGWATSMAQQPQSTSTPSSIPSAAAHWSRGTDESALSAVAIKLASNDASPAAAAAPATRASTDAPQEWVLLGAGVWLILAVSRRRKRTPAH